MFHLVLMLCAMSGPSCSAFDLPKAFPSDAACRAEGTAQASSHLIPKDGDGGARINGFICIKS